MVIKPSTALRNNYSEISALANETGEPVYITKNGEGDLVIMSIEAFERYEQLLKLRTKVLLAEAERLSGARGKTLEEVIEKMEIRYYDK